MWIDTKIIVLFPLWTSWKIIIYVNNFSICFVSKNDISLKRKWTSKTNREIFNNVLVFQFKWAIFNQTGLEESGKNPKSWFFYWAWSTPWTHVFNLKTFCRIPVLSWEIRYANFLLTKFVSSLKMCATICFQLF